MTTQPPEQDENLWRLLWAPAMWAAHLFACYLTVALWCGKPADRGAPLHAARWLGLGYTIVALTVIVVIGARAYRRYYTSGDVANEFDTAQARHRFLGFTELLLSILSFFAIVYAALPFGFVTSCR